MRVNFTHNRPWYDVKVNYQFWAYYDSTINTYFCFARKGKYELQGESTLNFDNAYTRLAMKTSVPEINKFVLLSKEDLKTKYRYFVTV